MPHHSLHAAGMKRPCVYILASRRNGTLYVGVTSNLAGRIWQHQHDLVAGFTQSHGVHTLVWFEQHTSMATAIVREKSIKHWRRQWKLQLIESVNPTWRDLYPDILDSAGDAAVITGSPPARG
jgi:putative endonuclease